mmetsp:Transcript_4238/g.6687  ORF Transcript_4238/g.6687 Transcript_4238/m.6687 type:complete len:114 (+) Transcript_4238:165-506(+)
MDISWMIVLCHGSVIINTLLRMAFQTFRKQVHHLQQEIFSSLVMIKYLADHKRQNLNFTLNSFQLKCSPTSFAFLSSTCSFKYVQGYNAECAAAEDSRDQSSFNAAVLLNHTY